MCDCLLFEEMLMTSCSALNTVGTALAQIIHTSQGFVFYEEILCYVVASSILTFVKNCIKIC